MSKRFWKLSLALGALVAPDLASQVTVDYDIVYVRQPRYGAEVNTLWP